jgi:hypothetical protein
MSSLRKCFASEIGNDFSRGRFLPGRQFLGGREYVIINVERGAHASDVMHLMHIDKEPAASDRQVVVLLRRHFDLLLT